MDHIYYFGRMLSRLSSSACNIIKTVLRVDINGRDKNICNYLVFKLVASFPFGNERFNNTEIYVYCVSHNS